VLTEDSRSRLAIGNGLLWIRKYGRRVSLQPQPLKILTMLLERPGQLVTRDELQDRLWPNVEFLDFNHGLNRSLNKLRQALADSADSPRYIETLPSRGYRFIAPVSYSRGRLEPITEGGSEKASDSLSEKALEDTEQPNRQVASQRFSAQQYSA